MNRYRKEFMINKDKTPNYNEISQGSNKIICLQCDYCGIEILSSKKKRGKSNEICDKDACNSCRYKKREEVSLIRDGVKNSAQREDIKNKIRESNSDRLKSQEFKDQSKQTMLLKYGVESAMHSKEIINKVKDTVVYRYGVDNVMKYGTTAKDASKKSIQTRIDRGLISSVDGKTLPQHAKDLGWSRSHFGKLVNQYGFEDALTHEKQFSSLEKNMMNWLNSENIEYDKQFRIENRIADFKIGNVIIECDGLYWHSDLFLTSSYHADKQALYSKNGYRSLFFREDELRDKFDIIQSIIKNAIGQTPNRVFARKLKVREISSEQSREFMSKYHLMGGSNSTSYSYSLDNLAVIQFKRIKDNNYDIARFCTKPGYSVIGGFSKLVSHFAKLIKPDTISTFIDMRYGTGNYLETLGFNRVSCYNSFKWTDGKNTYHRLKYSGNSGYEFGMYKIWDCGQAKFLFRH